MYNISVFCCLYTDPVPYSCFRLPVWWPCTIFLFQTACMVTLYHIPVSDCPYGDPVPYSCFRLSVWWPCTIFLFQTACMVTLYLLHYTDYFKVEAASLSPDELLQDRKSIVCLVGAMILRHIAQLVCNGHAITKLDRTLSENENSEVFTEQQVRIATAIYPSASMMNHSCDPNIINRSVALCTISIYCHFCYYTTCFLNTDWL